MYDPNSEVPMTLTRESVNVFGKSFPFTNPEERHRAINQAKAFGRERLTTMRHQANRALTVREQATGELTLPTDRAKPRIFSQPDGPNPDRNPWRDRLAELKKQFAPTRAEKAQLQKRIEFAMERAEQWDAEHVAQQELENRPVDDDLLRIRAHAQENFERTRSDPTATVMDIVARKKLLALAFSPTLDVGEYWHQCRLLDGEGESATPAQVPYQHQ